MFENISAIRLKPLPGLVLHDEADSLHVVIAGRCRFAYGRCERSLTPEEFIECLIARHTKGN